MEERRIVRLENVVDAIGPQLTDIKVTQAQVVSKLDVLSNSMETVKDLAQAGVSAQLVHTRCAAIQEERWRQHDGVHDNLVSDLKEVIKVATDNRLNLVKIMAVSSVSGLVGGGLIVPIIDFFKSLAVP